MTAAKTTLSFAKQVIARIAGDDNEALAQKIARKATSGFNSQLAALNSRLVDAEDARDVAVTKYEDTLYPSEMIQDTNAYCNRIVAAKNTVDDANDNIDDIKNSIEIFTDLQKQF